jgi:hypothetical protein
VIQGKRPSASFFLFKFSCFDKKDDGFSSLLFCLPSDYREWKSSFCFENISFL